ncbi:MAG: hypothetical protein RSB51_05945 [Clostridia bacterium]
MKNIIIGVLSVLLIVSLGGIFCVLNLTAIEQEVDQRLEGVIEYNCIIDESEDKLVIRCGYPDGTVVSDQIYDLENNKVVNYESAIYYKSQMEAMTNKDVKTVNNVKPKREKNILIIDHKDEKNGKTKEEIIAAFKEKSEALKDKQNYNIIEK